MSENVPSHPPVQLDFRATEFISLSDNIEPNTTLKLNFTFCLRGNETFPTAIALFGPLKTED